MPASNDQSLLKKRLGDFEIVREIGRGAPGAGELPHRTGPAGRRGTGRRHADSSRRRPWASSARTSTGGAGRTWPA